MFIPAKAIIVFLIMASVIAIGLIYLFIAPKNYDDDMGDDE